MQAIETKYYGPTNTKGSKIVAKCARGKLTVSYDHALNIDENHKAACGALCAKFVAEDVKKYGTNEAKTQWGKRLLGGQLVGGSWAWVFVDSADVANEPVRNWAVKFTGREVGAIGIFERFSVIRVGKNAEQVAQELYNDYDHITGVMTEEVASA